MVTGASGPVTWLITSVPACVAVPPIVWPSAVFAPTLTANVDPVWKIALPVTGRVPIVVPSPGATVLPQMATSPATLPVPRSEDVLASVTVEAVRLPVIRS